MIRSQTELRVSADTLAINHGELWQLELIELNAGVYAKSLYAGC
ncbi:MAG: hypothetical protein ACJ8OJ_10705 [Povalibacter sp.]